MDTYTEPAGIFYPAPCDKMVEPAPSALEPSPPSHGSDKAHLERKQTATQCAPEPSGLGLVTHAMAMGRLRRLFKPKANGQYKVPEELVKKWNEDEGREEIVAEFAKTGFRKDWVWLELTSNKGW